MKSNNIVGVVFALCFSILITGASSQEASERSSNTMVMLHEPIPANHPLVISFSNRGLEIDGPQQQGRRGEIFQYVGLLTIEGDPVTAQEFAEAIQAYQATHSVEITVHMIEASRAASDIDVPDSLDAVVDTLKETFGYPNFKLLETVLIRGVSGSPQGLEVSGTIPTVIEFHEELDKDFSLFYNAQISTIELEATGDAWSIGIEKFYCGFQVPYLDMKMAGEETSYHLSYRDVGVSTALQLREGQQVVVGKSNVKSSSDALFIVVSAKVVD